MVVWIGWRLLEAREPLLMPRSFFDNITACFQVLLSPFKSKSVPLRGRIDSAKMTHSRLKALETPDHLKEMHAQSNNPNEQNVETDEFGLYTSEEEVSKRVRSLADMSQYRLAALAKNLPPDVNEQEK